MENVARLIMMQFSTIRTNKTRFSNHPERGYSFTDCMSFALTSSIDVNNVFAFDSHFAHFGFNVYPET